MAIVKRERKSVEIVMYALFLYFLGLSLRNTSRALQPFAERTHIAVWEWVQRFDPKQVYPCKRIAAFLIDETQLQIGSTESWVLNNRLILSFTGSDLALIIILEFSMKGEEEH